MKFAVAMGFRDVADSRRFPPYVRGQSSRRTIHDWVCDRYWHHFPDAAIFESDCAAKKFNRAEARNLAVRGAFAGGADVVLVADADVTFNTTAILSGLRSMEKWPEQVKWFTPYTEYVKANRRATAQILDGDDLFQLHERDLGWRTNTGTAGLMLVSREAWETIGGYDATFTEWGWEDWAVVVALETLVHGVTRTHATCVHLEHDRARDRVRQKARMEPLYEPYRQAHGNPEAMRALLRERGALA